MVHSVGRRNGLWLIVNGKWFTPWGGGMVYGLWLIVNGKWFTPWGGGMVYG
jgi:hypothetical protein